MLVFSLAEYSLVILPETGHFMRESVLVDNSVCLGYSKCFHWPYKFITLGGFTNTSLFSVLLT